MPKWPREKGTPHKVHRTCLFILWSNEKSDLLARVSAPIPIRFIWGGQGSMFFLCMCVYKHSCRFVYVSSYKQWKAKEKTETGKQKDEHGLGFRRATTQHGTHGALYDPWPLWWRLLRRSILNYLRPWLTVTIVFTGTRQWDLTPRTRGYGPREDGSIQVKEHRQPL